MERYEEAIAAYAQAIRITPKDANILAGRGVALLLLDRLEEAIAAFDEVLKLDPKNTLAMENKTLATQKLEEKKLEEQKLEEKKRESLPPPKKLPIKK